MRLIHPEVKKLPNNNAEERDKNGEPRVYALVKGRSLDDAAREELRQEIVSTLARYGVIYQRDADAGVLPGDVQTGVAGALLSRIGRSEMKFDDCPQAEDGVVNVFIVGRLKYPKKFDIQGLEAVSWSRILRCTDMSTGSTTAFPQVCWRCSTTRSWSRAGWWTSRHLK
jgi:hypothetical protein